MTLSNLNSLGSASPNAATLGVRVSTYGFYWHTNIQSIKMLMVEVWPEWGKSAEGEDLRHRIGRNVGPFKNYLDCSHINSIKEYSFFYYM